MSQPAQKTTPPPPVADEPAGERIRSITFVTRDLNLTGPNSLEKLVRARTNPGQDGWDIWFRLDERRYRLEYNRGGSDPRITYVHESRVDIAEKW